jgi:hypothetical protein
MTAGDAERCYSKKISVVLQIAPKFSEDGGLDVGHDCRCAARCPANGRAATSRFLKEPEFLKSPNFEAEFGIRRQATTPQDPRSLARYRYRGG